MPDEIKITKEEINELPLQAYEGPVQLVETDEQLAAMIGTLSTETLLGFDIETRPCFRKGQSFPAATLQLAGESDVYVVQLLKLGDISPIAALLENPEILKVGVAIQDDIRKLQETLPFQPRGFVEIATLTQRSGILNTGLRSLAAILLNFRISKRAQVSNWARPDLTAAQVQYAATDAWVSRLLYLRALELVTASENEAVVASPA